MCAKGDMLFVLLVLFFVWLTVCAVSSSLICMLYSTRTRRYGFPSVSLGNKTKCVPEEVRSWCNSQYHRYFV